MGLRVDRRWQDRLVRALSLFVELRWPDRADDELRAELHRIIVAVVERGGAVGWLEPPDRPQTDRFTDDLLARVRDGDAALCLALVDGVAQAMACWQRRAGEVFARVAEVVKVMAHPDGRGLGLGRLVTAAVVDHALEATFETVVLGVRGNNHRAIALYEELGFRECGRVPNVIAVGDLRFDEVVMVRQEPCPPGVTWWGGDPGGPGSGSRPA